MTPQQYLDSVGLGHLRAEGCRDGNGPAAVVPLAYGITLAVEPADRDRFGGVWLSCGIDDYDGQTRAEAEAHLDDLAREAEATAARYRAALAVLRGEAPQPEEVTP